MRNSLRVAAREQGQVRAKCGMSTEPTDGYDVKQQQGVRRQRSHPSARPTPLLTATERLPCS